MILKTGWQVDPQQRMIQKLMLYGIPFTLLLSGWYFPIGVVIYWVTQNLVSLGQQQWVLRKYPPLITTPAAPTRTARERAAATTVKEPGAIKRFFLVLPAAAKTADAPKRGWLARLGIGKNKPMSLPEDLGPRSLAPRPGAKPRVRPAEAVAPLQEPDDAAPETPPTKANGGASAKPTAGGKPAPGAKPPAAGGKPAAPGKPEIPVGRMPAPGKSPTVGKTPESGPSSASSNGARGNGSGNARAEGDNAGAGQSGAAGTQRSGNASGGAGRPRPAANKSTPARRKGGQTGRKGGAKR
jgi:hypothetical protein